MDTETVASVPTLLSGVLLTSLGAGIGFLGAWVSNRAAGKRQKEQLAHDARLRESERMHQLSKDVAFEIASTLAQCQNLTASLAQAQTRDQVLELTNYTHLIQALTKVYLIGNAEVIAKSIQISSSFAMELSEISNLQLEVAGNSEEIKDNRKLFNEVMKRQADLGLSLSGLGPTASERETIQAEIRSNTVWSGELNRHSEELHKAWSQGSMQVADRLRTFLPEFRRESIDLIVALRKQLGVDTSDNEVAALFNPVLKNKPVKT